VAEALQDTDRYIVIILATVSHRSLSAGQDVISACTQETASAIIYASYHDQLIEEYSDLSTIIQAEIDLQPRAIQMVDFLWCGAPQSPSSFGQHHASFGRRHLHSCIN